MNDVGRSVVNKSIINESKISFNLTFITGNNESCVCSWQFLIYQCRFVLTRKDNDKNTHHTQN